MDKKTQNLIDKANTAYRKYLSSEDCLYWHLMDYLGVSYDNDNFSIGMVAGDGIVFQYDMINIPIEELFKEKYKGAGEENLMNFLNKNIINF